jgi:hypothetical protein
MITLIYTIDPDKRTEEMDWLNDQKVFPAMEDAWDWRVNKPIIKVGVIVSPETALEMQVDYKQR